MKNSKTEPEHSHLLVVTDVKNKAKHVPHVRFFYEIPKHHQNVSPFKNHYFQNYSQNSFISICHQRTTMNNKRSNNIKPLYNATLAKCLCLAISIVPISAFTSCNQRSSNGLLLSKPFSPVIRNKLNFQHEDSIDGQLHIDAESVSFDSKHHPNIILDSEEDDECDRSLEEQCDLDNYLKFLNRRYHRLHDDNDNTSNALYVLGVAKLASQRLLHHQSPASNDIDSSRVTVGESNIVLPYMRKISAGTSILRRINYRSTLQFFTKACAVLLYKMVGLIQNVMKNPKFFSLFSLVVLSVVPLK